MKSVQDKELARLAYVQQESAFEHHTYEEEQAIYDLLAAANPEAIEQIHRKFTGEHNGTLSADPTKNARYQFIVDAALVARACIRGGLPHQLSFRLSDLYIQKADACTTAEAVTLLHREMLEDYVRRLKERARQGIFSKPVQQCVVHIQNHLHQRMTVKALAEAVGLNPAYLSVLFKKTMGVTVSDYVRTKKLETAKNLLAYSEFSYAEIAQLLALGSQSHFTALLKADCGLTPKQYRDRWYQHE